MQTSGNFLIYLASASPRRSALLQQIGVTHHIWPVDVDEGVQPAESPAQYVQRLAVRKAEALWSKLTDAERRPVLGADTTVALGSEVLGKPHDEHEHLRMLRLLSGRTHQVYTAVALRHAAGCTAHTNVSEVSFRALADEEILGYWRTGEPADKAGGYAVQGVAAVFIERIAGSYSGIMGLPLYETAALLQQIGWRPGAAPETSSAAASLRVSG